MKCLPCDNTCLTCENDPDNCLTCASINGFDAFLENSECVINCPDGFYAEDSNNTCTACADGCATCTGGTVNDCLNCDDHSADGVYYKYIGETTCGSACPKGQFIDANIDYACQACASECTECVTSSHNCTKTDSTY